MFMSSSGYAGVGMLSAPRFAAGAAAVPGAAGQARSQAWVLGMASRGDYDAVDGYTAFEQDTSAYGAGYDFRIGDGLVLGLAGGQAGTDLEMADAFGTGSVDGWFGNAYGTWFSDARYLEWGVTYNRQDIETLRTLQVGTDIRTAASVHDGDAWSLFVGAGQAFRFDRIQLQPYVNLQYFGLSEDGFDETGAGSLNQSILARDTEALFGEAGVSIGRQLTRGRGYLDWNLLLGVNHDFELDDRRIRYSYAGAPDNVLTLDGRDVSGTSAVLGGSLGYFGERIGTSIEYRGRFNSDYDEQALALMFRLRF